MASFNQQPKRLSPLTGTPARMATLYKKYTGAEKKKNNKTNLQTSSSEFSR
jgi:hypothetical protein